MRSHRVGTVIVVLALLVGGAPAGAYVANDNRFAERFGGSGGRTGQGVHPTTESQRWRVGPPADADWQGPLLLDRAGHVLTFVDSDGSGSRMVARDLVTGAQAWLTSGSARQLNPDCVAVQTDGTIWAQTSDGTQLLGIDPTTGGTVATIPAPASACDTGLQVLPDNRLAYLDFCCTDRLHVVDLTGGAAQAMPQEMIYDAFLLTSPDGRRAYVTTPTVELLSVDLATGVVVDRIPLPAGLQFGAMDSSVVRQDGAIFLVVGGDLGAVMRIDDDGTGDLTPMWRTNTVGPIGPRPSSLLLGGTDQDLVVGWQDLDGADTLLALDANTGALVRRTTLPPGASRGVVTAAMLTDGHGNVVIPQVSDRTTPDGGVLYDVLDPAGQPVGRSPIDVGQGTSAMVLTADGTLIIRTTRAGAQSLVAMTSGRAPHQVDRLAGPTRIDTAIAVSRQVFPRSDVAVLARADTYPDSLAGATLAHDLQAPVLLTDPSVIGEPTLAELQRMGARTVMVLGGTAAVGAEVVATLRNAGFTVERVSGGDRFATAAAVAAELPASDHAFVTSGRDPDPALGWPESLLAAPWAAQAHQPLLLVEDGILPQATREALARREVTRVTVIGDDLSVPAAIVDEIEAMGIAVTRLSAADRYRLSSAVSRAAVADGAGSPANTWLATGLVFADALSAGAAVAATGGTLMLLDGQDPAASQSVLDDIAAHRDDIDVLRLVGGTAAITDAAETAVRAALTG